MRVASIILIFIGLIVIMNQTLLIAEGSVGGRWVIVIFLLEVLKMWLKIKKINSNDDEH